MKTVCRALGLARSHVHELHHRSEDWHDGRTGRQPWDDAQLLAEIREQIAELRKRAANPYWRPTTVALTSDQIPVGCQRWGKSSSMWLALCVGSRVRTSLR
jgi:hypothetical protein